jgi:hypothetical protein
MHFITLAGDLLAWATFIGLAAVGWVTIGVVTARVQKTLKLGGRPAPLRAGALFGLSALLLLGGWLIVDAVWVARRLGRLGSLVRA